MPAATLLWVFLVATLVIPVAVIVETRLGGTIAWSRFEALLVLAVLTPFFSVRGVRGQWFVLTSAVCVMAIVLAPAGIAVAVAVTANIVDWIKRRYLPGNPGTLAGIGALHNGLVLVAGTLVADGVDSLLDGRRAVVHGLRPLLVGLVFVAVVDGMTSIYLRLGSGHRIRDLLQPEGLATEVAVSSTGAAAGLLWLVDPWYSSLLIAPLGLAHLAQRVGHLKIEAAQDAKTRLLNSARFEAELADEVQRAARRGLPLALLAADLDLLREVNNEHGHVAGDAIIVGFADTVRAHLRRSDIAGRFGGEEFFLLLPATTTSEADKVAERIRDSFAATLFGFSTDGGAVRGTVSIGVASYPEDGVSPEQLVKAADRALYYAKSRGRNQVVRADECKDTLARATTAD